MRIILSLLIVLGAALPSAAQTDTVSIRPYGLVTVQAFSAQKTFDAVFGQSIQPFWGAGAEVLLPHNVYVDVSASRFKKTGQRAFMNPQTRETFGLGIPLSASITPIEITGGYRFQLRQRPTIVPFAGAGIGSYAYKETSDFSDASDNVDTRHIGVLFVGGVEFRVQRWVAVSVDAQFTHIPGILGEGGISKDAGESDLGGTAARFKLIIGR